MSPIQKLAAALAETVNSSSRDDEEYLDLARWLVAHLRANHGDASALLRFLKMPVK